MVLGGLLAFVYPVVSSVAVRKWVAVNDHPGGPGTAARLANVPGCQKLIPLSSADERWPKKVAKAITETRTSNLGERLSESATGHHP